MIAAVCIAAAISGFSSATCPARPLSDQGRVCGGGLAARPICGTVATVPAIGAVPAGHGSQQGEGGEGGEYSRSGAAATLAHLLLHVGRLRRQRGGRDAALGARGGTRHLDGPGLMGECGLGAEWCFMQGGSERQGGEAS